MIIKISDKYAGYWHRVLHSDEKTRLEVGHYIFHMCEHMKTIQVNHYLPIEKQIMMVHKNTYTGEMITTEKFFDFIKDNPNAEVNILEVENSK